MKWHDDPEELKRTRKRLGLTQTALAAKAGVKLSLIANIESKRRKSAIPSKIWEALARTDVERRKTRPLADLLQPEKVKELKSRSSKSAARLVHEVQQSPDFVRVLREVATNLGKDNQQLRAQVAELRGRVDLLVDLLDVKTREVRAAAEAQDLKEKLERS